MSRSITLNVSQEFRVICFASVFESLRMLFGGISVVFLMSLGFTPSEISLSKTIQAIIVLIMDIPFSLLGDRFGHKKILVLTVFFDALYFLCLPFVQSAFHLYALETMNALAIAGISGSLETVIVRSQLPSDSLVIHKKFGKTHQWMYLCSSFAGLIGGTLAMFPRWVCFASGFGLLALSFVSIFLLPPDQISFGKRMESHGGFRIFPPFRIQRIKKYSRILLPLVVSYSLLSVFIQLWQVLVNPMIDKDFRSVYGLLFFCILLAQSFAGRFTNRNYRNPRFQAGFLLVNMLCITLALYYHSVILAPCIVLAFFQIKTLSLVYLSSFHELISEDMRSRGHSMQMVLSRLLNVFLFAALSLALGGPLNHFSIPAIGAVAGLLMILVDSKVSEQSSIEANIEACAKTWSRVRKRLGFKERAT